MPSQRQECLLSAADFPALARALKGLGLAPEEATWFHGAESPPEGWPLSYRTVLPSVGLHVSVLPEGEPGEAHRVGARVRVRIEHGPPEREKAAAAMQSILQRFREERRLECGGAEFFLGSPPSFAWTQVMFAEAFLPAIERFLEAYLSEWTLIKRARPRDAQTIRRVTMRGPEGAPVTVYSDLRMFLRNKERWLVVERSTSQQGLTQLSVASSGTPDGWDAALVEALGRSIREGGALGRRRMTPSGKELELDRSYTWDDLYLDDQVKSVLIDETEGFFGRKALYAQMDLPFRRGVLLHGPPGTGKTLTGKILASQLGEGLFVWVTASHIADSKSVTAIFDMARHSARTVLFFEDLDLYASRRGSLYGGGDPNVLGELLVQLDGMQDNDGLLVVATTNDLEAIEPALRNRPSRFDSVLRLEAASADVRRQHLLHMLGAYGVTKALLRPILARTDGFTGAQLQELALRARKLAAEEGSASVQAGHLKQACSDAVEYRAPVRSIGFDAPEDDYDR
ncbi:MAG: ATP-binding protein [Myxococcota bacterium]